MLWQNPPEGFTGLFAGKRFLSGQKECGFVSFAVSREPAQGLGEELSVVARVISRRQVVEQRGTAIENRGLTIIGAPDIPHLSKERRLLPEIGSLHSAQENIKTVGMTCAVMAGEAVHIDA